jgi:hypothetical protein
MLVYNGVDTNPSKECPLKAWIPMAKDVGQWISLIYKCQNDQLELKRAEGLQSLL